MKKIIPVILFCLLLFSSCAYVSRYPLASFQSRERNREVEGDHTNSEIAFRDGSESEAERVSSETAALKTEYDDPVTKPEPAIPDQEETSPEEPTETPSTESEAEVFPSEVCLESETAIQTGPFAAEASCEYEVQGSFCPEGEIVSQEEETSSTETMGTEELP